MEICEIKFTYLYLENRTLKSITKDEPENWDGYFFGDQLAIFQQRKNYQQKWHSLSSLKDYTYWFYFSF